MPIEPVAAKLRAIEDNKPYVVETATGVYLIGQGGKVLEKLEPSTCPACERAAGSDVEPCDYCRPDHRKAVCSWCLGYLLPGEKCACNT